MSTAPPTHPEGSPWEGLVGPGTAGLPGAADLPTRFALRRVRYDAAHDAAWRRLLSDEEHARLEQFAIRARQQEFVAGRAAARLLLAERLGCLPVDVPLRVATDGGVDVEGTPWHLSISHSGLEAVAAVALGPLGVDLERVQPRPDRVWRFVMGPEERAALKKLPIGADTAFTLAWALKESVLKARRTGLRMAPRKLRLHLGWEDRLARVRVGEQATWAARFDLHEEYVLAVAYRSA